MSSVSKPRCANGQNCYHVVTFPDIEIPTPVAREGDICFKCAEYGLTPNSVPEEYEELFRAARVLFEEGVTDEEVIIPTLAFAAYSWEKPGVAYLRNRLPEVAEGGEVWENFRRRLFLNTFDTLEPETVVDGVLFVRHVQCYIIAYPFDPRKEKTQPVEKVFINIHSRPVKADDVARRYERALQIGAIPYERSSRGSISYKVYPDSGYISMVVRAEDLEGVDTIDEKVLDFRSFSGEQGQLPFPPPSVVGSTYKGILRCFGDEVLQGRKSGPGFENKNLVPACVAWYIGGRGDLNQNTELRDEVVRALDAHFFGPLGLEKSKLHRKSSDLAGQLWKVTKNASQLIERTDKELLDPRTWARFYFNLTSET